MKDEDKETLKIIIDQTIKRLSDEIAVLAENCKPIAPDCSLGTLGRMEAIEDQKVSQELLKQTEERLLRLKYAKERIDSPNYGLCLVCDDEIPMERLKLVPESTICMECANERQ